MTAEALIPRPRLYEESLRRIIRPAIEGRFGRISMHGLERFDQFEGRPFILAPKHRSLLDIPLAALAAREAGRQVSFMAKAELLRQPLLGRYIAACGGFPVDRTTAPGQELEIMVEHVLDNNGVLGIFPEGTRMDKDEIDRKQLKRAVAAIALKKGVPIVPVGIAGTGKGDKGNMAVVIGEPVKVDYVPGVALSEPRTYLRESKGVMDELYDSLVSAQEQAVAVHLSRA